MEDCIFCKIASGKLSVLIAENEYAAAFDDINPVAPIHVIIVPKKHIQDVMHVTLDDEKYIKAIHQLIQEVARLKKVDDTGFRIISNCGNDGGQTIPHLHYHLIGGKMLGEKLC